MSARWFTALVFLVVATFTSAASWDDDSHYVSLGPRNGYYIVQPDSNLIRQLGLYEAPVIDTADPLRHGYGADALAFRFNRNGVLIAPPAYIAQGLPYDFYMRRIGSLTRGRATTQDVEAMFGRGHSRANRPDGFMWYYALPVYNPFEERGGGRPLRHARTGRPLGVVLDSYHASRDFSGDPVCGKRFGDCEWNEHHQS